MSTKLITIIGATGQQGSSVAQSLLRNPSFRVRGVTRNIESAPSQKLRSLGAEVVKADLFNSADLAIAFEGAWGAYVNTNTHDPAVNKPGGPVESDMAKIILDAAAKAGVKHVVVSSGPPGKELTGGKVDNGVMEEKRKMEEYAYKIGKFETVTPVVVGWYFANFLIPELAVPFGGFPHFPDEEGYLTFKMPHWGSADGKSGDDRVPFISISDDLGDIVHGVFLNPTAYNRRTVPAGSDQLSWAQAVADYAEVTGKKARFDPVLPDYTAMNTFDNHAVEGVQALLGLSQLTGGLYYGRDKTELDTSAKLKRQVAELLGYPEEKRRLKTSKVWMREHFG